VDKEFSIKEALAIKDGKIMAVGKDDELKGLFGPKIEVLDLRGKTVLLGINDSHLHGATLGGTRSPLGLDLSYPKVKSISGAHEIKDIPTLMTVVGGKIVYDAG
jgi:predicted amidohydrolase YtcJ